MTIAKTSKVAAKPVASKAPIVAKASPASTSVNTRTIYELVSTLPGQKAQTARYTRFSKMIRDTRGLLAKSALLSMSTSQAHVEQKIVGLDEGE